MTTTEGVLIAVIIILTVIVVRNVMSSSNKKDSSPLSLTCVDNTSGNVSAVNLKKESLKPSYERSIDDKLRENQEYFAVCGGADETNQVLDCVCGDKPDVSFAKFDYGAPNMDYKDFVASQAVDNKVIENHLQFVRDRKGLGPEGEFITGRTYSPDSHDSYDPIPWMGIRGRPQAVSMCNPTQIPDLNENLYKGHRPYCFWT